MFCFLEEFVKNWYYFECFLEFSFEAIGVWAFFMGSFKITNSISLFVIDLFRLSVFSWVSFSSLCLFRTSSNVFSFISDRSIWTLSFSFGQTK